MSRLNWKKLLVTTDFSDGAKDALPYAVGLARETGASITLLHVVPTAVPADLSHLGIVVQEQALVKNAQEAIQHFRRNNIPAEIPGENIVLSGGVWYEITELARKQGFDAIVIATHGYTGLKHFWMGSTAENVVRHAPCAVLAVREQPIRVYMPGENPMRAKKIFVPIDFSESSTLALQTAVALAEQFGSRIDLFHVIEPPPYPEIGYAHIPMKEAGLREVVEIQFARLREQIPGLRAVENSALIRIGNPAFEITQTSLLLNSNLVVLGTHGRTGLKRLALGSTAEKVVRRAPCPVLVVREKKLNLWPHKP